MKYLYILFAFLPFTACAQIIDFPPNQETYVGGKEKFYSDFHNILVKTKKKPCEDKGQMFLFPVVIYPDSTIKFVMPEDPENVEKNKCAYELSKDVTSYLKGWKPAVENGEKVAALTYFWIIPDQLFENYKAGYAAKITMPEFKGGLNNFRKKVGDAVNLRGFKVNQSFRVVVSFIVNTDGKLVNVKLLEPTLNESFNNEIISAIRSIKTRWTPANVGGIPISYQFYLPLGISL